MLYYGSMSDSTPNTTTDQSLGSLGIARVKITDAIISPIVNSVWPAGLEEGEYQLALVKRGRMLVEGLTDEERKAGVIPVEPDRGDRLILVLRALNIVNCYSIASISTTHEGLRLKVREILTHTIATVEPGIQIPSEGSVDYIPEYLRDVVYILTRGVSHSGQQHPALMETLSSENFVGTTEARDLSFCIGPLATLYYRALVLEDPSMMLQVAQALHAQQVNDLPEIEQAFRAIFGESAPDILAGFLPALYKSKTVVE